MNKALRVTVFVVVAVLLWFGFAPSQLGGRASYVTIQGISMQPNLYTDDLVLLHKQDRYYVGDAVAFRAQNMAGAVILHRIIEMDGDRFVLQGDNNDFIDEYRPLYEDILGKQVAHIPQGSKHLGSLRAPWAMAAAFAIAALTVVSSFIFVKRSRHRRRKGKGAVMGRASSSSVAAGRSAELQGAHVVGNPVVLWVLAVGMVIPLVLAYLTPLTTETPEPRPYSVTYDFNYTAPIPPGNMVYDQGETLSYGQPVFLNVIDTVDVSVDYSIANPDVQVNNAELRLKTVLVGSAGWQHTLAEAPPVQFAGRDAASAMSLNFREALAVGDQINQTVGTVSTFRVAVVAETYVDGQLLRNGKGPGGVDEFTVADFGFNVDTTSATAIVPARFKQQLPTPPPGSTQQPGTAEASSETGYTSSETGYASSETGYTSTETGYTSSETGYASTDPAGASTSAGASADAGANANSNSAPSPSRPNPSTDPSIRQITQMVPTDVNVARTFDLWFVSVPVSLARNALVVVVGFLLTFAVFSTLTLRAARKRGPVGMLVARYGKRMVPMDAFAASRVKDVVDLPTFDALYAVSLETEQLVMFHYYGGESADFYVADNGTTYRYAMRPAAPAAGPTDPGQSAGGAPPADDAAHDAAASPDETAADASGDGEGEARPAPEPAEAAGAPAS